MNRTTKAFKHLLLPRNEPRRTHVMCIQTKVNGLTYGRCYEVIKTTRAGVVLVNDRGDRRVYGDHPERFDWLTAAQAKATNKARDDWASRAFFFMMSGEWLDPRGRWM